mgnify:CR=1 FL=1
MMTQTVKAMYTKLIVKTNCLFRIARTNCLSETNRPANCDPSIQRISTSTRMGSGNWKTKCEFNTETKVYDVLVTSLYGRDLPSRAHWQLLAWECIKYQILACGSTVWTIWCLIDSHHSSPVTFWNDAHSRIYESKIRSPYTGPWSIVSDPVGHTHIVFHPLEKF